MERADIRTVEPYGIVNKQAVWYLVARAPAGMRTYRLSRMQNAVVLAVTFERPANFDLAAHWKSSTAQLQQKRTQFHATSLWHRTQPSRSAAGAAFLRRRVRSGVRRWLSDGVFFMFPSRTRTKRGLSLWVLARAQAIRCLAGRCATMSTKRYARRSPAPRFLFLDVLTELVEIYSQLVGLAVSEQLVPRSLRVFLTRPCGPACQAQGGLDSGGNLIVRLAGG